jgi:small multidrug resistance pump
LIRNWLLLGLAIAAEMFGFYALEISDGLTQTIPAVTVFVAFSLTYWLLARIMKRLPLGVVYALWSGCTIVLTALMDLVLFGQQLALAQVLGIACVVFGVVWLNLSLSDNDKERSSDSVQ